ncbi:hypothetical protein GGI15_003764 [Coemansia interrupta]|uniref:Uncharacterized protein n=1 Tax=Coemansia interrupta TaxID=1126814 RepID=A0A9W8LI04_9FUNG|nr:hypothetical protein GGI15_003764 [Coemansia interrupta]
MTFTRAALVLSLAAITAALTADPNAQVPAGFGAVAGVAGVDATVAGGSSTPSASNQEVGYSPPQQQVAAQEYEANKGHFAVEVAKVLDRQNSQSESLELDGIDAEDISSLSEDLQDEKSSSAAKLGATLVYGIMAASIASLL